MGGNKVAVQTEWWYILFSKYSEIASFLLKSLKILSNTCSAPSVIIPSGIFPGPNSLAWRSTPAGPAGLPVTLL